MAIRASTPLRSYPGEKHTKARLYAAVTVSSFAHRLPVLPKGRGKAWIA